MSQQINLFNAAFRKVTDPLSALPVAALAVGCLVLVAALSAWANWRAQQREAELAALQPQAKQAQEALATLTRDSGAVKKSVQLEAELNETAALLLGRQEVLRVLAAGTAQFAAGYSEYLRALARQSVSELWLTGFSFADGTGELTLRGRTLDPAHVPVFIKRLGAEKAMQGREIADVSMQDSSLASASAAQSKPAPGSPRQYTEFVLSSGKSGKPDDQAGAAGAKR
jgi:Tfp pilus assembly protein PilW